MSKKQWNEHMLSSDIMRIFRKTMFRRIVPNLKRIHLLSPRVRPHYEAIGLLEWENETAAPDLSMDEILGETLA